MILSPTESTDFFRLFECLDTFTNRRLRVLPDLDEPAAMRDATLQQRNAIRTEIWNNRAILDEFVRENPFGLSTGLLDAAACFRHAVRGQFFVERVLKKHAIFISTTEPARVYAVEGLTQRIDEVLSRVQPLGVAMVVDATLLPYRGRIVWDGLVSSYRIQFGPGTRASFKSVYTRAKDRGQIATVLGEVPIAATSRRASTPDWTAAVGAIVTAAEALGKTDTTLKSAAFGLLKQSARLAKAAADNDHEGLVDAIRKVERALRKVIGNLDACAGERGPLDLANVLARVRVPEY